jgi:hypothetical protein
VRRREPEEDDSPYLFCEICEQMYERVQVQECPYCEKRFCRSCAVRSGSQSFCGRSCAKNWFFADDEEDTGGGEDRGELDKGDH